ncbi:hypothetical protein [Cohnella sp.]|uniref:hypothetical protein n=1 Tax=Cohnella sp. TaxID=1883426 RepID=UPI003567365D
MKAFAAAPSTVLLLMCLQGCMASSTSLTAHEAFALSASALSGIDRYEIEGQVFILGPGGYVFDKAGYEGKVIGHGNLKLQWRALSVQPASVKEQAITSYRPLQLLEIINDRSAVITYAETPKSNQMVHFKIKLDDRIARERAAGGLRAEMKLLRSESGLLKRDPVEANKVLSRAEKRLEEALATLKVTTTCAWTANPQDWLPRQLKEETVLSYTWNAKAFKEERVSETNFHLHAQDDTIKRSKGHLGG